MKMVKYRTLVRMSSMIRQLEKRAEEFQNTWPKRARMARELAEYIRGAAKELAEA